MSTENTNEILSTTYNTFWGSGLKTHLYLLYVWTWLLGSKIYDEKDGLKKVVRIGYSTPNVIEYTIISNYLEIK